MMGAPPYYPDMHERNIECECSVHLDNHDVEGIWLAAMTTIDYRPELREDMQTLIRKCRMLLGRPLPDGQIEYGGAG